MLITYTPAVGSPVEVSGIFDELYVLAKGDPEAGVETLGPAVFLLLSQLPVHPDDDDPILTIPSVDGVDYRVTERRTAGLGAMVLVLRKVT